MTFDLDFLDDSSKEIREHLFHLCDMYNSLTDEKKAETKTWLETLIELENKAPAFSPRIVIEKMISIGNPEEGNEDYFHWRLTPEIILKAIKDNEQKNKYVIEMDDILHWF